MASRQYVWAYDDSIEAYNAEVQRLSKSLWKQGDGTEVKICGLSEGHLHNALNFLLKNPQLFAMRLTWEGLLRKEIERRRLSWGPNWQEKLLNTQTKEVIDGGFL